MLFTGTNLIMPEDGEIYRGIGVKNRYENATKVVGAGAPQINASISNANRPISVVRGQ